MWHGLPEVAHGRTVMGVLGPIHLAGRRCREYPLVQDTVSGGRPHGGYMGVPHVAEAVGGSDWWYVNGELVRWCWWTMPRGGGAVGSQGGGLESLTTSWLCE